MNNRVEISKRLLLVNSASGALARIVNVSVLVWLNQYLLRRIGKEEFSLYPTLTSVILLMPLITSILTSGLGRYVLAAYAKGDDRGVTRIVSTMLPILTVVSGLLWAGGWLFAWHIDKILTIPPERLWDARIMMALLMFSIAMQPIGSVFGVGIYVRQKYILYNMMNVSNQLFRAFLLFALLYGISARVLWVVVANVVADFTLLAGTCVVSMRMIPALRFDAREIRWRPARELISFGGWSFLGNVAQHLRQTAIPLILNKTAPLAEVTLFYVGFLARRQIDAWSHVMVTPLYPVMTGMHAMGAHERVRNVYTRGGRIALWVLLLPVLPTIIYSQTIIRLYVGDQYADAGVVMVLTLGCLPVTAGTYMLWPLANAVGRVRLAGAVSLATQLTIIAGAFYMVVKLHWGAVGVALATFVVLTVASVGVTWRLGQKLANITFGTYVRQTLLPGLTPGCVGAAVWVLLDIAVRPETWTGLGLCTLIGTACYIAVLLGFCLEPQDRQDLTQIQGKVMGSLRGRYDHGCDDRMSRLDARESAQAT